MKRLRQLEFYELEKGKWLIDFPEYGYARVVTSSDLEKEFARLQCTHPAFVKSDLNWNDGLASLEVDLYDEGELFSYFLRSRRKALDYSVEKCSQILSVSISEYLAYENNLTLMTMNEYQKILNRLCPENDSLYKELRVN